MNRGERTSALSGKACFYHRGTAARIWLRQFMAVAPSVDTESPPRSALPGSCRSQPGRRSMAKKKPREQKLALKDLKPKKASKVKGGSLPNTGKETAREADHSTASDSPT